MSFDIPPFQPRFPWWGGDLQTLANRLAVGAIDLAPHTSRGQSFRLDDGTGDTLLAKLDRPARPRAGAPLVILIHGLTGSQDSTYMLSQSRCLLDAGFRVLRLNLRGAGPSRALCGGTTMPDVVRTFERCWPFCRMSFAAMEWRLSATRWAEPCFSSISARRGGQRRWWLPPV